ncbi:MAG TPA: fimbria/pilus periplasmic chaperone [Gammaproteobacteria bacterium]|nr:fimbria/pilus periplasmic chaperone [Gammaproteobacteria bacterium]
MLLFDIATPCFADTYTVAPVSMTLEADSPRGEFRLVNQEGRSLRVQIDVNRWSQEHNWNEEQTSTDFIVSPRFADIAPHGVQIVRVAYRYPVAASQELSYRVLFREIPSSVGLRKDGYVALNYSIPLFVEPSAAHELHLAWSAIRTGPTGLLLCVDNAGGVHGKIKIHSLSKQQDVGTELLSESDFAAMNQSKIIHYVLAGTHREMQLGLPHALDQGAQLLLSVDVNTKHQDILLTLR